MNRTLLFTGVVLAAIIGYDVWTLYAHGYTTTISAVGYDLAKGYPIIPFALGVVVGHLYWPNLAARRPS